MINITGKLARQKAAAELIRKQIRFERMLIRRIVPLIDRQAKAAARIYRQTGSESDAELAISAFNSKLKNILEVHYKRTGVFFGNDIFNALNKSVNPILRWNTYAARATEYKDEQSIFLDSLFKWISSVGADRVVKIQNTTKDILKAAILAGREAGEGQDAIAKRIVNKISGIGRLTAQARARTIARTETHNAQTFAQDMAADSTGLELIREWLTNDDERTRTPHSVVDGQRRKMGEPFDVDGEKLMRPGDPSGSAKNTTNCRCGVIYHTA